MAPDLPRAFNFRPADLAANRNGQLSPAQDRELIASLRPSWIDLALIVGLNASWLFLLGMLLVGRINTVGPALRVGLWGFVLLMAVWFPIVSRNLLRHRARWPEDAARLTTPQVVEGRGHISRAEATTYWLAIGGKQLVTTVPISRPVPVLDPAATYRAYYLPTGNDRFGDLLLSIEQVGR